MAVVVKIENLSKAYQIGQIGTGTLTRDVERWWLKLLGKEDPFLKIGEENIRNLKGNSDIVWSVKNVNATIMQGEAVGIIGKNGAGKSTLLKMLSRVTAPTTGSIKARGRIASLLEVGTGFHPELTGRENIFLNGAILGMRHYEIKRKLDEIVSFSGVERYIDTPVKRYSSGMYVRLAFAVAAHLEAEILIVDEVLAVGDAEFQKKCLGKMSEVSKGEGRTVLFVSHNMQAIKQLCNTCMLMDNGILAEFADASFVINKYLSANSSLVMNKKWKLDDAPGNKDVKITAVWCHQRDNYAPVDGNFDITQPIGISVSYTVLKEMPAFIHGANIYDNEEVNIFNSHDVNTTLRLQSRKPGNYTATVWIPGNLMTEGRFTASIALLVANPLQIFAYAQKSISFAVVDNMTGHSARGNYTQAFPGYVRPLLHWDARIEI
jgi:lipopolysaccharide transport system ATP-binding protein